jgi:hypothetical protein
MGKHVACLNKCRVKSIVQSPLGGSHLSKVVTLHAICSRLFGRVLEVGNEVVAVLGLLQATERHLGTGDVLLRVLEVLEKGVVVPLNTLLLVGIGVRVTVDGTGLAAPETVQSRSDLVATVLLNGVALSTSGLEEVGTLLDIAASHCECGLLIKKLKVVVITTRGVSQRRGIDRLMVESVDEEGREKEREKKRTA